MESVTLLKLYFLFLSKYLNVKVKCAVHSLLFSDYSTYKIRLRVKSEELKLRKYEEFCGEQH